MRMGHVPPPILWACVLCHAQRAGCGNTPHSQPRRLRELRRAWGAQLVESCDRLHFLPFTPSLHSLADSLLAGLCTSWKKAIFSHEGLWGEKILWLIV